VDAVDAVDAVDVGSELKNVDTGEYIALLNDRTLPIKFFIGVGSQCERVDSDCGEGTAQPDQTTTIVTTHGQAGVVIPAGALDQPATIIIESADDRPCIAGLPEPVFSGSIGPIENSCYDIHTDPPLAEVNALGKFNTNVTVGICAETGSLDHATRDLLQIFQLHAASIFALRNVGAPSCLASRRIPNSWDILRRDSARCSSRGRCTPRPPWPSISVPVVRRTCTAGLPGRCRASWT